MPAVTQCIHRDSCLHYQVAIASFNTVAFFPQIQIFTEKDKSKYHIKTNAKQKRRVVVSTCPGLEIRVPDAC